MARNRPPNGAAAAGSARSPMRKIAVACLVGSAIEFYDFMIYGTAAALVFPSVFFPDLGPTMATVASMATFATAFLSRPLGAAVFGYFGDRLGRKKTLVATLLIMGGSTVSVGMVPDSATIGIAAPLILIVLRLLQGFAVGGEWAGSVLLSAEYAPPGKRAWYGMFTMLGGGTAGVLASLTFLAVNFTVGENSPAFLDWGWRVPFLLSSGLIVIALYVRLNIDETPVFVQEKARDLVPKAPLAELWRLQRREIVLVAGAFLGGMGFIYLGTTFVVMYAHSQLGFSRNFIWGIGALSGVTSIACASFSAWLSDRVGRRRVMLVGLAACLPWSFVVIPLIDTGEPVLYAVAVVGMFAAAAVAHGPTGAFVPELFATRYRYSGSAVAMNLAGILGAAMPPLLAGTLLATYGSWAIGLMMATLVVASVVSVYLLPETKGTALQTDPTAEVVGSR